MEPRGEFQRLLALAPLVKSKLFIIIHRIIPGSHLWGTEQPPDESLTAYAELSPGDAFIMLGSAYHGGSANRTKEEERLVYSCFMTRGYLRQEENQYLAIPMEVVKGWPVEYQQMVG
jgi:ectoine hydroxylase-related dioxygenase (phytanoyl-CoA dioxygenase family)